MAETMQRVCTTRVFRNHAYEWTKIYVKNLDEWFDTEGRVFKLFDEYGDIKDIQLVRNRYDQPIGVAYVTFADHKAAIAACRHLNGVRNQKGVRLFVERAFTDKERLERAQMRENFGIWRVVVKNLNDRITDRVLYNTFKRFGIVLSYMVVRNDLGYSLCYGYLAFLTEESADRAVNIGNNMNLYGDRLRVEKVKSFTDYQPPPIYGRKIFVKGIGDEKTLRQKFKVHGCIENIEMMGNKCYVTFTDKQWAHRALADIPSASGRSYGRDVVIKMAAFEPKDERDTKFKPVHLFHCNACNDWSAIDLRIGLGCEHQYCWHCLKKSVESAIGRGQVKEIKCIEKDCDRMADQVMVAILTSNEMFDKYKDCVGEDQICEQFQRILG